MEVTVRTGVDSCQVGTIELPTFYREPCFSTCLVKERLALTLYVYQIMSISDQC